MQIQVRKGTDKEKFIAELVAQNSGKKQITTSSKVLKQSSAFNG